MATLDLETALYVTEWAIRIGALGVVPLRRAPGASAGWLLLIFLLPLPGLALFLAIGSPHFPAWRRERFSRLRSYQDEVTGRIAAADDGAAECPSVEALARKLGYLPAVGGNLVELIDDYDAVIDRLVADIDGARAYVLLLVYIFADDAVGHKVAAALGRAVARGVACRVMLDPVGSRPWRRGTLAMLREARVEVREALPFRWLRARTRRDMRNHRKLFVIDGRTGYAGSQNLVLKDFKPKVVNRELVVRTEGPIVAALEAVIRADWYLETEAWPDGPASIPAPAGEARAQLLPSGADYPLEGFETLLVWQIHEARRRVVMATPYFIPDQDVLGAMRSAVARGVEVDLIVSAVVDQRLVNLAQSSYYDDLLGAGVRIHLYRDRLLHAKNVGVDDTLAIVGSSNVDLRSFQLNEEASLLLYDAASISALGAVQQGYLENSDTLTLEQWRARGKARRVAENIARLVSPLL